MHLLEKSPKKQDWLHVKRMNENNWSILDPQSLILIKIGMTSKSVAKRLNEWENKCNHRLISINPYCLKKNSILSLFKKLSISHGGNDYTLKTYDMEGQGFFTESNLSKIEKEVHSTLWKLYGKGDIVCHGCKIGEKIGIHKEWFLVKRTNLDNIFKLIDKIVIENSV
ncbi:hypothetical protein WICMUC_002455 [Wickerhamomyces mucosus]|uniref:Bacteriophage T5 Orf172 DNA-binding domain-containing protein n=1 Tax=Wickerhamomyces mucosus TaxID=1378264 RepID=A0A9P8PQU5_9ASCO|nr:hypothetical protein WICMUC_002455 [Wickerhamomyces mucosus]